ncbi:exported hypothetical protein [Candidatus Zixiibacteriota bacterium]|nr:exported hypothetical protein [candidate division Zixibacteria bacterium]
MRYVLMASLGIILVPMMISFASVCGDANRNGVINILDVSHVINYLYKSGSPPIPPQSADVNLSGSVNILDATYLIDYLYRSGPAPLCHMVSDIDGNAYFTVTIGTQVWMAENLQVTHYSNGDAIPYITDAIAWSNLTTGAYSDFDNNINNAATYGRLYNWYAAADSRNIAPSGWHVPNESDWLTLINYLGGFGYAGWKMKEAGTMHWYSPNTGANNESGFSVLPAGCRYFDGVDFLSMGYSAFIWSATDHTADLAWNYYFFWQDPGVSHGVDNKHYGFSIRCVKD